MVFHVKGHNRVTVRRRLKQNFPGPKTMHILRKYLCLELYFKLLNLMIYRNEQYVYTQTQF